MTGAAVVDYLAARDYARFVALVRRYNHDVLSRFNNLVIATEVCAKLLRNRASLFLIIPIGAEDAAQMFDAIRNQGLELAPAIRHFVWGDDPDDRDACEARTRELWYPYDAAKWDHFVFEYTRFVGKQLLPLDKMVKDVETWAASGVLHPPEQSQLLLTTMSQIGETLELVWAMLTPAAAEERITPVLSEVSS